MNLSGKLTLVIILLCVAGEEDVSHTRCNNGLGCWGNYACLYNLDVEPKHAAFCEDLGQYSSKIRNIGRGINCDDSAVCISGCCQKTTLGILSMYICDERKSTSVCIARRS